MATRARISRPQSITIQTGWLPLGLVLASDGVPRRAVAVQQMSRKSSPSR